MSRASAASALANSPLWNISDELFASFRDLIYREAGIALTEGKKSLFVSRMAGRLRELQLSDFDEYYRLVCDAASVDERGRMLDRICTNETQFFRDARQFQYLNDELFPRLEAEASSRGSRRIRAWSAACSTGEEPYTIAMSLLSAFPSGWELEVLGSDISTKVLDRASAGIWPIEKAKEIPEERLKAFMLKGFGAQEGLMKAGPELHAIMRFARVNLAGERWPAGPFDLVFCRNVLIYFDRA